jgi:hypothetical protein
MPHHSDPANYWIDTPDSHRNPPDRFETVFFFLYEKIKNWLNRPS